jgi:hypothetical protein
VSSGHLYISHDVIFYENIFPFANLSSSTGVRYSAEVLLLPLFGARSNSTLNDILPSANAAPPVLLPFDVLQPQKILAPGSASTHDAKNQVDHAEVSVQPHAAPTGTDVQADLASAATVLPAPVPDSLGARLASTRVTSSMPNIDSLMLPAAPASTESSLVLAPVQNAPHTRFQSGIRKPKIYSDGTVRYANLTTSEEPANLAVAITDPNWKKAMDSNSQFLLIIKHVTWSRLF